MNNISEIREEYANCSISDLREFVTCYGADKRSGIKKIVGTAKKKLEEYEAEVIRISLMSKFERQFSENGYICGVDEVGRGPLAGPVVAAAVIFPKDLIIPYVNDSKKLSEAKREKLFNHIMSEAISVGFGSVDNNKIDEINILQSTFEAMKQAVSDLNVRPDIILVDGNKEIPGLDIVQRTVVGGDAKCLSIAAASIVAKVVRDRYMREMSIKYPMYDFASNKGYGSEKHYAGIKEFGISPIHRKTYVHDKEGLWKRKRK
nr:ribonuclease HII [uncultured Catonella sp.]